MCRSVAVAAWLILAMPSMVRAQGVESRETAIYVEALGPTEYASLNVDHLISSVWSVRGGFQIAGSGGSLGQHYVQVPVSLSRVHFWRGVGLEAGVGGVGTVNGQYEWDAFEYYGSVGLRSRPFGNGAFIRAEILAMPSEDWRKLFGVGIGYAF